MRKILGVKRDVRFSPASEARDEAVFSAVCRGLEARGCAVCVAEERNLALLPAPDVDAVFSMARSEDALQVLSHYEERGIFVLNPVAGVCNGNRVVWNECFRQWQFPVPHTATIATGAVASGNLETIVQDFAFPCWVKRADQCSQQAGDVCFVTDADALLRVCDDFSRRGISSALLSAHVEGDVVKFYGVHGTDFFHCFYPTECGYSKFGWERVNGAAQGTPFDVRSLHACCDEAACRLQLPVYGGDCIVGTDGAFYIIDWNDWPSFSCCLYDAADAIVSRLLYEPNETL